MPAVSARSAPGRESRFQEPEPEQRDSKPGRAWGHIAGPSGSLLHLAVGGCPLGKRSLRRTSPDWAQDRAVRPIQCRVDNGGESRALYNHSVFKQGGYEW
jgi:hypothetical protein